MLSVRRRQLPPSIFSNRTLSFRSKCVHCVHHAHAFMPQCLKINFIDIPLSMRYCEYMPQIVYMEFYLLALTIIFTETITRHLSLKVKAVGTELFHRITIWPYFRFSPTYTTLFSRLFFTFSPFRRYEYLSCRSATVQETPHSNGTATLRIRSYVTTVQDNTTLKRLWVSNR